MMNATNGTNLIRRAGLAVMVMALSMIAHDASAIERKGFIVGFGFGGGQITCDGCESLSGPAFGLHLGGMLNEKVALVVDLSSVGKDEDGVILSSIVLGPAVQYWATPRVWLKAGVGGGVLGVSGNGFNETSDWGLGFLGGVGVELLQKKKFTIDLQGRFTTAKIEGERTSNFSALIGFNFY